MKSLHEFSDRAILAAQTRAEADETVVLNDEVLGASADRGQQIIADVSGMDMPLGIETHDADELEGFAVRRSFNQPHRVFVANVRIGTGGNKSRMNVDAQVDHQLYQIAALEIVAFDIAAGEASEFRDHLLDSLGCATSIELVDSG